MTMTLEELADHATRLQHHLECKKRQALAPETSPKTSAYLLVQVFALEERVEEILSACQVMDRQRSLHLQGV